MLILDRHGRQCGLATTGMHRSGSDPRPFLGQHAGRNIEGSFEMKVLVTGSAGFIGFHVAKTLLQRGDAVVGFDVVNSYYDPALKEARLKILEQTARENNGTYSFVRQTSPIPRRSTPASRSIASTALFTSQPRPASATASTTPTTTCNPISSPSPTSWSSCRHNGTPHLTYASTSSIYGANTAMPFSEHHGVNHPLQFYAATKRANELMAHAYSHMFRLPTTGLRFFTVYGPWACRHGAVPVHEEHP